MIGLTEQHVDEASLSIKRSKNYKKLQQEMAYVERKGIMTAAQSERQKTIDMMGSLDARKRLKNR